MTPEIRESIIGALMRALAGDLPDALLEMLEILRTYDPEWDSICGEAALLERRRRAENRTAQMNELSQSILRQRVPVSYEDRRGLYSPAPRPPEDLK